ncbi:MAG: outer membrane lipoprotein carrier protein LolA [Pyrinomonadaceae bacterium]
MKRILKATLPAVVIAAFLGIFSVNDAFGQDKLREILNRMDIHNKGMTTLRARVTMVKTNAQLGGVADTTVGTALYAKGKGRNPLVRIDWEKPEESLAVRDGKYIMYRPRLGVAYVGSTDSAGRDTKSNSALAFMSMSKAELRANYEVALLSENATLSSGVQTWHLRLTPIKKTSYKLAEIWVDPNGMPHQTKIIEQNDDTTTVLLTNLEKNVKLDGDAFEIKLAKGTKVQKS